jgi:hypothetical protein
MTSTQKVKISPEQGIYVAKLLAKISMQPSNLASRPSNAGEEIFVASCNQVSNTKHILIQNRSKTRSMTTQELL